jgi:hypothetical protein
MKTAVEVYVNGDDALLRWSVDELDDRCLGFAVQRSVNGGATEWLENYAPPGPQEHQVGAHHRSDEWHFRCFSWTDHGLGDGDTVSYRVLPVLSDAPEPREDLASPWSEPRTLGATGDSPFTAYFNRGFVMSQFVSRWLDAHYAGTGRGGALDAFKRDITREAEETMRRNLSGRLRMALLDLLDRAAASTDHVYAALFELGDEELVGRLEALGPRAHVVLANGSIRRAQEDGRPSETDAEARTRDANATARARLIAAGVDVPAGSRFVSPKALAHNTFVVVTTAERAATRLWTGSTDWTTTGLCTQLNNGLLVDDPDDTGVAEAYLAQWRALRDAGSTHPRSLTDANDAPRAVGDDRPGTPRASVQFTRVHRKADITALGNIVRGAREGVLFLMFMPGDNGVLSAVRRLAGDRPDLLVRGIVSELPRGREDERTGTTTTLDVTLVGVPHEPQPVSRTEDVIQAEGMAYPAASWAIETTRAQFFGHIGHAIVHSKVLVVDPFTADPTVVTGSHNFSSAASDTNDENFIVVRGDRDLAEAYAVNVQTAWRHYVGRAVNPHEGLTGIRYLRALRRDQHREERFWHRAPVVVAEELHRGAQPLSGGVAGKCSSAHSGPSTGRRYERPPTGT